MGQAGSQPPLPALEIPSWVYNPPNDFERARLFTILNCEGRRARSSQQLAREYDLDHEAFRLQHLRSFTPFYAKFPNLLHVDAKASASAGPKPAGIATVYPWIDAPNTEWERCRLATILGRGNEYSNDELCLLYDRNPGIFRRMHLDEFKELYARLPGCRPDLLVVPSESGSIDSPLLRLESSAS